MGNKVKRSDLIRQIDSLQRQLTEERTTMPTFETLEVCWSERTIHFKGRTITTDSNCIAIPLTNDVHLLVPSRANIV